MPEARGAGPFENNGITPSYIAVGAVTRIEAAREVIAFLAEKECLGGELEWDELSAVARETWVSALATKYGEAHRRASKAAMAELAALEERAITLPCRSCYAGPGEKCRNKRTNVLTYNKHVHQERLDDLAREGL